MYCFWSPLNWIISWLAYWSTKCWDYLCCWWTQLQSVGGKNNRQQTRWCRKPVSFWRYWVLSALLVVLYEWNLLIILHIELSNFLWLLIINFGDCPNGKFPVWDRPKRNHQMVVTCIFIKGNIQLRWIIWLPWFTTGASHMCKENCPQRIYLKFWKVCRITSKKKIHHAHTPWDETDLHRLNSLNCQGWIPGLCLFSFAAH